MQHTRNERIKLIFEEANAIITNTHVVYTSGMHGDVYVNKDAIYPFTSKISELCQFIAQDFQDVEIDAVIGPVVGGVALSQWTAYHLSKILKKEVFALYADKVEKDGETNFVIKRGQDKYITMKKILVIEDVLTTGTSVRKVVQAVRDLGGIMTGVGALCSRGGVTYKQVGDVLRFESLMNITLDAYFENECPLCKKGVPINVKVGKGAEFLAKNQK